MRKAVAIAALVVGMSLSAASPSSAVPLTLGDWQDFGFGGVGSVSSFDFTSAGPVIIRVVDGFIIGDEFTVSLDGGLGLSILHLERKRWHPVGCTGWRYRLRGRQTESSDHRRRRRRAHHRRNGHPQRHRSPEWDRVHSGGRRPCAGTGLAAAVRRRPRGLCLPPESPPLARPPPSVRSPPPFLARQGDIPAAPLCAGLARRVEPCALPPSKWSCTSPRIHLQPRGEVVHALPSTRRAGRNFNRRHDAEGTVGRVLAPRMSFAGGVAVVGVAARCVGTVLVRRRGVPQRLRLHLARPGHHPRGRLLHHR